MIALAGGTPVIVPTREENRFVPEPQEVESRITPATKAILINSPSNPTGVIYPEHVLEKLAALAENTICLSFRTRSTTSSYTTVILPARLQNCRA